MIAGTEPGAAGQPAARPYEPALDGLRAVCLLAVLAFHAGFPWAAGGFLGVSTFFTLSGFLVTGLLLDDVAAHGRVDSPGFWRRRLRRLAPASLWVLAALAIVAPPLLDATGRARLGADVLSALGQVSNWRFLSGEYAYSLLFTQPSLVQHFWSLSIEAQFYLVFPLVVALVARTRAPVRVLAVLAVLWVGLAASIAFLLGAAPGEWDRIYYGSGLRLPELLLGVLLALAMRGRSVSGHSAAVWRWAGLLSLLVSAIAWTQTSLETGWLYRGGFVVYAFVSASMVGACVAGAGGLRSALAWSPLVWMGRVSYGGYLIHWPIYVALAAGWPDLSPLVRFAICSPISFALAGLSYAWIEAPVRRGRTLFGRRAVASTIIAMLAVALLVSLQAEPAAIVAELRGASALGRTSSEAANDGGQLALFGDSTALSFAFGFSEWLGDEAPSFSIDEGVSHLGCGVLGPAWIDDLSARGLDGEAWISPRGPFEGVPLKCLDFESDVMAYLAAEPADIAMVLFGEWDVAGVRDPATGEYRTLGDPEVDVVMKHAIGRFVDVLHQGGAGAVVWFTSPPLARFERFEHEGDAWERARLRYNVLLLEVAEERGGDFSVVDLDTWVRRLEAEAGADSIRHDGIHFTLEGGRRVAGAGLGMAVLEAAAGLEEASRSPASSDASEAATR